jgi:hypothetical protein
MYSLEQCLHAVTVLLTDILPMMAGNAQMSAFPVPTTAHTSLDLRRFYLIYNMYNSVARE